MTRRLSGPALHRDMRRLIRKLGPASNGDHELVIRIDFTAAKYVVYSVVAKCAWLDEYGNFYACTSKNLLAAMRVVHEQLVACAADAAAERRAEKRKRAAQ